jgi:glycosyltransferase involved in cell wall biosynthesis
MKLLIITQTIDRADPILGFFHRWIEEFAKHCASVTVIAQSVRMYVLPTHVHVHSLGKERAKPRLLQVLRFLRMIISERHAYDTIFVHMTPIWVVLGAPAWILLKKPVFLWYEAKGGGLFLPLSLLFARRVFSASFASRAARSRKSIVVGHGIDVEHFAPASIARENGLLVTVSRITASKRIDVILRCLAKLPDHYRLEIVGAPITQADQVYTAKLDRIIADRGLSSRVTFRTLTHDELVPLLQRTDLFLHASETTLDKAVLEAMACGCIVVSCAKALESILPSLCLCGPEEMGGCVTRIESLSQEERSLLRNDLRSRVENDHGLIMLIRRLSESFAFAVEERGT